MFTAKFKVVSKTDFGNNQVKVNLAADTNQKSDYALYTPSGNMEFMCTNPVVNEQINPGDVFVITFDKQ